MFRESQQIKSYSIRFAGFIFVLSISLFGLSCNSFNQPKEHNIPIRDENGEVQIIPFRKGK